MWCEVIKYFSVCMNVLHRWWEYGMWHGIGQIQERAPDVKWTHCSLHGGKSSNIANVSRMSGNDDCGLIEVNNIKKNAVNSRCIAAVVKNPDADQLQLLYHSEVRWFSREPMLTVFELRKVVHTFLVEQHSTFAEHYSESNFMAPLEQKNKGEMIHYALIPKRNFGSFSS